MKVVAMPRGVGKTTALIKRSAETQIPILVSTSSARNHIKQSAERLGLEIPTPIVATPQVISHMASARLPAIIDNAEMILNDMFGGKIDTMSVTVPVMVPRWALGIARDNSFDEEAYRGEIEVI